MNKLLEIKNISAKTGEKEILKGLNLTVNKGEVHVILGPNGAGKSTLANVILNNPVYEKTKGKIFFENEDITDESTDKISNKGIFMSFQIPIEIPGISTLNFLKYIESKKSNNKINLLKFSKQVEEYMEKLEINKKLLHRNLNTGFSGGEKKKNEILQMLVLNPKLVILDETDSGLDVDAVKVVSKGISMYKNENNAVIVITHNNKILKDLDVDYVHVLIDGQIVKTKDKTLIKEIEEEGYNKFIKKGE